MRPSTDARCRWAGRANHVGVEIRGELVREANLSARADGCGGRLRYMHADAATNNAARRAVFDAVRGRLAACSVMFPDPHYIRSKSTDPRRTLQTLTADLASEIGRCLPPGGVVFVASDVEAVASDMCAVLRAAKDGLGAPRFEQVADDDAAAAALDAALDARRAALGEASAATAACGAVGKPVVGKRAVGEPAVGEPACRLPGSSSESGGAASVDAAAGGAVGDDDTLGASAVPRWLRRNLWRVPTEREVVCEQPDRHGQPRSVHRAVFVRRSSALAIHREGRVHVATSSTGAARPGSTSGFYNTRMQREGATVQTRTRWVEPENPRRGVSRARCAARTHPGCSGSLAAPHDACVDA